MAKTTQTTITFTYKGKDYELAYTRETVKAMERSGFNIANFENDPMSSVEKLFTGSFRANHSGTKREIIMDIFSMLPDKQKLLETLAEMYQEPFEAMMDEPDEDEGKVVWTVNQ